MVLFQGRNSLRKILRKPSLVFVCIFIGTQWDFIEKQLGPTDVQFTAIATIQGQDDNQPASSSYYSFSNHLKKSSCASFLL